MNISHDLSRQLYSVFNFTVNKTRDFKVEDWLTPKLLPENKATCIDAFWGTGDKTSRHSVKASNP